MTVRIQALLDIKDGKANKVPDAVLKQLEREQLVEVTNKTATYSVNLVRLTAAGCNAIYGRQGQLAQQTMKEAKLCRTR